MGNKVKKSQYTGFSLQAGCPLLTTMTSLDTLFHSYKQDLKWNKMKAKNTAREETTG